ncbi:MAG: Enoyl-CoA hydratase [Chloroflexi bacterium]|jgi:2-(1,2-epoxy-1,2-dihydrophenyl)acetyl-CoA isomerase|nr:Enoyl-CoA hydratase [Chloroflexota bacterium]
MSQEFSHLLVETTPQGVRSITLNRPEKLNAINDRLSNELPAAIEQASHDDGVRVLVVTGAGRGFCAGLDLDPAVMAEHLAAVNRGRAERLDDLGWVGRMALALVNCDKPVIAALNGPAAGAGLGLALGADIRLMSSKAVVTTGYIRRGLAPDAGVSYFLPRLVGLSRATELILTARDVNAEEAERIGLVSKIIPVENFGAAVAEYAAQLASGPPVALTLTKRLLTASLDRDLPTQLRSEYAAILKCFQTADLAEAMRAFMEKRKPEFKGE